MISRSLCSRLNNWVRPVYQGLLHAASRFNTTPSAELKRPVSRLVEILIHQKGKGKEIPSPTATNAIICDWIGAACPVDFLNVWFPAHWAPTVLETIKQREAQQRVENAMCFDEPNQAHDSAKLRAERAEDLQSRVMRYQNLAVGKNGKIPTLICSARIDWFQFPVEHILKHFGTLQDGICRGVFMQAKSSCCMVQCMC